ncbi:MAG: hypothetical protein HGA44_12035 [Cellulomonadaceae bacterium]|nr:hypothetical protein [Cellulomonadaceae bacterium]
MCAGVTIATPLGPLEIAVEVDGAARVAPARCSPLPGGAEVVVWPHVGGLVVDALVTPMTAPAQPESDPPDACSWGVEWRLHAAVDTAALTISALLVGEASPSLLGGDEDLITAEFFTEDWVLAIGGPDEEFLSRLAGEGLQPFSWRNLPMPAEDPALGRGLVWRLPGLSTSETGRVHLAVAWCRTGHPASDNAPRLAVDTRPSRIRTAAGVTSRREERRAARGT